MVSSTAALRLGYVLPDSLVLRRNHADSPSFPVSSNLPSHGTLKHIGQKLVFTQKPNNQKVICYRKQDAPVLVERSIEKVYDSLAERLLSSVAKVQDPNSKYIVGLAGPPGAGKTTLASEVVFRVNKLWSKKVEVDSISCLEVAKVLPMDGFHLYRSQLDAMENPDEAYARRGAPWTFNSELLLKCLHALRNEGSTYAPSFDHGVGDPVEDDVFVSCEHKIVIVEGNYLFLEEETWQDICSIFDEKWFLDIDIDTAMQRVLKRHISTGKEPDVAKWRIEYNDRPNAELIMATKKNADLVIKSVDF
ncbi:uridine kinase [Canna indica]|uniref:Uridine kinase n=1 Tax=Canna indica TaxID=4628 RepID=A0AAQ3KKX2_9LILI|nr:uridine kinase [Canna indica]